jgi:hypothetical protein
MVADHQGIGDQGRVNRNSHAKPKSCSSDACNSVPERIAVMGQQRRIGHVRDESAAPPIAPELARTAANRRRRQEDSGWITSHPFLAR